MGPLLNSKDWDISYTVDANGEFAYFVSYANSNNKSADIFRVKLPEEAKPEPVAIITGKVLDEVSKKPVKAEITTSIAKNIALFFSSIFHLFVFLGYPNLG